MWASLILCDCRYVVIPWTPNKVRLTSSFCSMATKGNTMKYYYVLLLTLVIVSCNSNQQKSSSSNKETPQLSTAQDSVPEGWYNETLTPYTGKDKAEKNMISQMNTYNQALLRGDINNASLYIYPDVIKYCKKYYPELSDRAIYKPYIRICQKCITL